MAIKTGAQTETTVSGSAPTRKSAAGKKTAGSTTTKKAASGRALKSNPKSSARSKKTPSKAATKKNLVIVESPAKAKTIEKFLGKDFAVVASNGHLRDLPKSKLGVDIENNFEPYYLTIRGKARIVKTLKSEASKAEHVFLATDPDREGEAISWHLANLLDLDPNDNCRIEFNEITKTAVTGAIDHPRPIDMHRVDAQQARRVLDRVVGYKLSPLLWKKVKPGLSAGRVQSVAVRIIADREQEIRDFVPEEYWTITAVLDSSEGSFEAKYYGTAAGKASVHNEAEASAVIGAVSNAAFELKEVKEGVRKRHALPPFTTSYLQQAAGSKLGFTARKTMTVAQQLYEGVESAGGGGLITYMRTDSVRISKEAQDNARDYIVSKFGTEYVPDKPNSYKSKKGAQDAHEAIRPTSIERTPGSLKGKLSPDQYKLYSLVYSRFLASQMSDAVYDTLSYRVEAAGHEFRASGSHRAFAGHMAAYDSETEDDRQSMLPRLEPGAPLSLNKITPKQCFTNPPARFTEASLVKYLEEQGIGRPSTYATIISTIQDRHYVEKDGRSLVPTDLGEAVNGLLSSSFSNIVDVSFTAGMEEKLDEVEEDGTDWHGILKDFYQPFEKDLETADKTVERIKLPERVSDVVCEKCGALMVYKIGRYGEFLGCPNYPDCKNTKPIRKEVGVACPKCGSSIVERKTKKGRIFYGCSSYPDCDFVSWDKPLAESCPECGQYMVETKAGNGRKAKKCSNPDCVTNAHKAKKRNEVPGD